MAKIGFVFPGQGSQKQGMLADLAAENPVVLDTFTRASEVLGKDLWRICQSDPEGSLNQTEITQPALLAPLWPLAGCGLIAVDPDLQSCRVILSENIRR